MKEACLHIRVNLSPIFEQLYNLHFHHYDCWYFYLNSEITQDWAEQDKGEGNTEFE
jgi:hypothetical protein